MLLLFAAALLRPSAAEAQAKWYTIIGVSSSTYQGYDSWWDAYVYNINITVKNTQTASTYLMAARWCGSFAKYDADIDETVCPNGLDGSYQATGHYLAPNQTATVSIPIFVSAASGAGTVNLSVTGSYTGAAWPFHTPVDSKVIDVTVSNWVPTPLLPLEPLSSYVPYVTPKGTSSEVPRNASVSKVFTVQNNGIFDATYSLAASCGSMSNCSANKSSTTLAPNATDNVTVSFTTPSGLNVSNTVSLTATYTNANNQSISDNGTTTVVTPPVQPVVTPDGGTPVVVGPGTNSVTFTVTNNGTLASGYSWTPVCVGWVTSCSVTEYEQIGNQYDVAVSFQVPTGVGSPTHPTATVKLIATRGAIADTGSIPVALAYSRPSVTPETTSLTEAAGISRNISFTVTNLGNAGGYYNLAIQCTNLPYCVVNGYTTGADPGASSTISATYTAPAVGQTGSFKLIVSKPDGSEADTAFYSTTAADQVAPSLSWSAAAPVHGSTITNGARSFVVSACDNWQLQTQTVVFNGVTLTPSFSTVTQSGCGIAKSATVNLVAVPGTNTITFSVSDGIHTTTETRTFTYNEGLESRPIVTALVPSHLKRGGQVWADTFAVQNPGPLTVNYAVAAGCTATACSPSASSITVGPGQTTKVAIDYTTPTGVGMTATNVFPIVTYTAYNGSTYTVYDVYTLIWLDQIAPTIAFQSPTPAQGTTISGFPSFAVDWCDADGQLATHTVTLDGTPLPANYTSQYVSGCTSAGSSSWSNITLSLGTHTLVATATDVSGHETTLTRTFTFSLPAMAAFQPAVTPKDATPYLIPTEQTLTWAVRNAGSLNAQYQLEPDCTGIATTCQLDKTTTTLAPGAVDSVRMTYTLPAWPTTPKTLKLRAAYTDIVGRVAADTGTVSAQIPSVSMLYRPELPLTGGTSYFEADGGGHSFTVGVINRGIAPVTYQMNPTVTSPFLLHFSFPNDTMTVQPGQIAYYTVLVWVPTSLGVVGRFDLTVSATFNGQTVSASMTRSFATKSTIPNVGMLARGGVFQKTSSSSSITFDVTNIGAGTLEGHIADPPHCSGIITNCRFAALPSGGEISLSTLASNEIVVLYDLGSVGGANGYGGLVEINFIGKPGTASAFINRFAGVHLTYEEVAEAVSVTPDFLPVLYTTNQDSAKYFFRVKNTGYLAGVFDIVVECLPSAGPGSPSSVTCQKQTGQQVALEGGRDTTVMARFKTTAAEEIGFVKLTATKVGNSSVSDHGSIQVKLNVVIADISVRADTVNSGSVIARNQCVTIAAGSNAAYECGDLRIVHPLPATTTLNKTRAPTLIYNSAHATGHQIIAANMRLKAGVFINRLNVTLKIRKDLSTEISIPRTIDWMPDWSDGKWHRIAVQFNAADLSLVDQTKQGGLFKYQFEIQAVNDPALVAVDSGEMIVVDRSRSVFGKGWWVDGLEQLSTIGSDTSARLWIGGDGSARRYTRTSPTVWKVLPTVDRLDSLVYDNGVYRRMLSNGAYVEFNFQMNQVATVNQVGHRTEFVHDAIGLRTITLPVVASTPPQYQFNYENTAAGWRLNYVVPPRSSRTVYVGYEGSTRNVTAIRGPSADSVRFVTNATHGLIETRYDRLLRLTAFEYDAARLLKKVTIPNPPLQSIVTTFSAAEGAGLTQTAIDRDSVRTVFDGSRTDVSDVMQFYVTRYGAPNLIINARNERTMIARTDTAWRLLPTVLTQPNQHRIITEYSNRGLPLAVKSVAPLAPLRSDTAITYYQWHPKWDELVASSSSSPDGPSMTMGYAADTAYRLWQQSGSNAARRVHFSYDPATRLVSSTAVPTTNPDSIVYDGVTGNAVAIRARAGHWTTIVRDDIGRDSVTLTAVHANDLSRFGVEASRVKTVTLRDVFDRPYDTKSTSFGYTGQVAPQTVSVVNQYDAEGFLRQVTRSVSPDDNNLQAMVTRYSYDAAGRKTSEFAPDNKKDSLEYDLAGNVTRQITRTGDVLTMTYDVLNRLEMRATMAKTFAPESLGLNKWAKFPMHPVGQSTLGVKIDADTATFIYDALGNIVQANNGDAHVSRTYFPNGSLRSETQRIRSYGGADFSRHVFSLEYMYDLDGRRRLLKRGANDSVTYSYYPGSGELQTLSAHRATFVEGAFSFTYDNAGRLATTVQPGGITETLGYSAGDELDRRTESGTNYLRNLIPGPSNIIHADTLEYDGRGKIVRAGTLIGASTHEYTGLGAVQRSTLARPNANELLTEVFRPDALGNLQDSRANNDDAKHFLYEQMTGRLIRTDEYSAMETSKYDHAGNLEYRGGIERIGNGHRMSVINRAYYAADGKMRVHDRRVTARIQNPNGPVGDYIDGMLGGARDLGATTEQLDALEEYRYDALGRRVLKRTRRTTCGPLCPSAIERYVWDGDDLLLELRYPGAEGLPADSLERSAGLVFRVDTPQTQEDQPPVIQTVYSPHYGGVMYTHGGGMDKPLMMRRMDYGQDTTLYGEFVLIPHYDYRGIVDEGTFSNGQSTGSTPALMIDYPGIDLATFGAQFKSSAVRSWFGGLMDGMRDASGLQYRRNRYYDPQTGRFTQEDPIGLAGGLNLYGFADSDPVNFSDPFGLCPFTKSDESCYQLLANWGARTGRNWAVNAGAFMEAGAAVGDALMGGGCDGGYSCGMGIPVGGGGFRSFNGFKTAYGAAGSGKHWHHIVGQTAANVERFGAEAIHSADNLIAVDAATHARISGFYSSKQRFTNGKTVREWIGGQSFKAQHEFGMQILRDFGVIK